MEWMLENERRVRSSRRAQVSRFHHQSVHQESGLSHWKHRRQKKCAQQAILESRILIDFNKIILSQQTGSQSDARKGLFTRVANCMRNHRKCLLVLVAQMKIERGRKRTPAGGKFRSASFMCKEMGAGFSAARLFVCATFVLFASEQICETRLRGCDPCEPPLSR